MKLKQVLKKTKIDVTKTKERPNLEPVNSKFRQELLSGFYVYNTLEKANLKKDVN